MSSYLGTQAQAVGVGRYYGGLLGRADRLVLILIVGAIDLIVPMSFFWARLARLAAGILWGLRAYHRVPAVPVCLGKGGIMKNHFPSMAKTALVFSALCIVALLFSGCTASSPSPEEQQVQPCLPGCNNNTG